MAEPCRSVANPLKIACLRRPRTGAAGGRPERVYASVVDSPPLAGGAAVATTGGAESGAGGVPGRFLITRKRTTPSVIRRSCDSVSIKLHTYSGIGSNRLYPRNPILSERIVTLYAGIMVNVRFAAIPGKSPARLEARSAMAY